MDYEKQISAQNNIDVMTWQNGQVIIYISFFSFRLITHKECRKVSCHNYIIRKSWCHVT